MNNIHNLNSGNGAQPKNINVSLNDVSLVECDCGSTKFRDAVKLGKLSKVHPDNPTGKTVIVPFNIYVCVECNEELDPQKFAE